MSAEEAPLHLLAETSYAENVIDVGKVIFGINDNQKIKYSDISSWAQNKKELIFGPGFEQRSSKDLDKELNKRVEDQVNNLTRAACALLNSGGGVIRAEIENEYCLKTDEIGTKIENSFRKLIQDRKSDLFFDFKQEDSYIWIFVKTWTSGNSFTRLCSLTTGLYERSGTCAPETKPKNVMELLWMKKREAKRSSPEEGRPEPKRVCRGDDQEMSSQGSMEGEENPAEIFFRREQLEFGEILDFTESNTIEFKAFPRDEDSLAFVSRILPRYASAFANTDGGYLFFGVNNDRKVTGCKGSVDPVQFKVHVYAIFENLPRYHFCPSGKTIIFELKALPVEDEDGESHGYVFAVRFEPFSGVVFQSEPDSWIVEAGQVKRLTVPRWIELMTAEDPDLSELANDFARVLSVSEGPPMVKPVYSVSDLKSLRENLFPADSERIAFIPKTLCDQLFQENPGLKELMESEISPRVKGTLMFSRSWAVDIGLSKKQDIVCDAVLIAPRRRVRLWTIIKAPASRLLKTADVYRHSRKTVKQLKHKLVNIGGFSQKICVISRILCLSGDNSRAHVLYPKTYRLQTDDLFALQESVVIVLLSFTSFLSDFLGIHFLNLLTIKQYENISKNLRKTPRQFIYGLPGSGKTVIALEILKKIRNEFNCNPNEILYICENQPLRDFVRKKIGPEQAVTRKAFMSGDFDHIKHIVVDEAQNFQARDNKARYFIKLKNPQYFWKDRTWYKKAERIVKSSAPGVFWIFLDYFQKSHLHRDGVPLKHQYPREYLTTVVRNATSIYVMMQQEMERIVEKIESFGEIGQRVPHQLLRELLNKSEIGLAKSGVREIWKNMSREGIAHYVAEKCQQLLNEGYSKKDIAILCTTQETANDFESLFSQEIRCNSQLRKLRLDLRFVKADEIQKEEIVLDSIRRFSGLERPIVFGINPVQTDVLPSQTSCRARRFTKRDVDHNLLLSLVSRANLHLYLLYEGIREP